jgi:translation initiation factor IF-2
MREQSVRTQRHITLVEIDVRIALGQFKELNITLKGDVDILLKRYLTCSQIINRRNCIIIHKGV